MVLLSLLLFAVALVKAGNQRGMPETNAVADKEALEWFCRNITRQVRGCYNFNNSFGLCFDIRPDFIKLSTKNGDTLVLHHRLDEELSLSQILDHHFLGFEAFVLPIRPYAPTSQEELQTIYWRRSIGANFNPSEEDKALLKIEYKDAMKKLSETEEMSLLELLSEALTRLDDPIGAAPSFSEIYRVLLKGLAVQLSPKFRAAPFSAEKNHANREKGCTDLRPDPFHNQCLGMCGPRCTCWKFVCGECCRHRGCYEHDLCCKHDEWSSYCLLPFGFSCSGYKNYPKCLRP